MTISRRKFITLIAKGSTFIALATALPRMAWAKWNEKAFKATDLNMAINAKYEGLTIIDSEQVELKAPEIAENGAVVPIRIMTQIENVKTISLFVKENPSPLSATLNFSQKSIAEAQIRIRMGKTSDVIALVEADGKLYRAQQLVKVTIGGCGG